MLKIKQYSCKILEKERDGSPEGDVIWKRHEEQIRPRHIPRIQDIEPTQNLYEEQEHSQIRSDSCGIPHTNLRDRQINQRASPEIRSTESTAGSDAQTTPEIDSSMEIQRDDNVETPTRRRYPVREQKPPQGFITPPARRA